MTKKGLVGIVLIASVAALLFAGLYAHRDKEQLIARRKVKISVAAGRLQEAAEFLAQKKNFARLNEALEQFRQQEKLSGAGVVTPTGEWVALAGDRSVVEKAIPEFQGDGQVNRWYFKALPLRDEAGHTFYSLVLIEDLSPFRQQWVMLWQQKFFRYWPPLFVIALLTFLVAERSFSYPLVKTVEALRRLRMGEATEPIALPKENWMEPLSKEIAHIAKSLTAARAAAEQEAKLRHAGESRWTPERLKEHTRVTLQDRPLVVVSNREPYMHVRQGRQVQCIVPASGLVTAVEPILRACGGTWVAHGSGEADREMVDQQNRLRVPPEVPAYTLKRVWLTKKEEEGYYYGFSNEGLWPLCHIAHTRPIFRVEDWEAYMAVNAKFADAVVEELEDIENPYVLIQDYHFALLPKLIKQKRPDAQIALFWHIPWPNPEAFGICPWARELLQGMLAADLLGFHIQFHCNNFLDTVDRVLESRIEWEQFAVHHAGSTTLVKPFPISIEGIETPHVISATPTAKAALLKELGVQASYMAVGVDRIDYTKGITERLRAVERFLERNPSYKEKFVFVELGAPSRSQIKRYQDFEAELDAEVERINRRFETRTWKPVVFLKKHHSHQEIAPFYQAADLCLVTSLHDGMNLVAKEFVASRSDENGVLILSRFAGASRQLSDALLVNPYDVDQVAGAIRYALEMSPEEQKERMLRMRQTVQEQNVYRWAADLITELAHVRPVSAEIVPR